MAADTDMGTAAEKSWLRDIEGALEVAETTGGNPLPLVPDFAEVIAKARTVLTVSEIAEIAGVKDRQVHHWAAGDHTPGGGARDRLLQLFQIITSLETTLNSERIKVWMWTPQFDLPDAPVVCLRGGEGDSVLSAAQALAMREEASDPSLVELAKQGNTSAYDALIRRYRNFARHKAASYSGMGPNEDDLIQEGLLGLYKAIRDFPSESSQDFQLFAERCITRQIIGAVKTARHRTESEVWIPLPDIDENQELLDGALTKVYQGVADEAGQLLEQIVLSLVPHTLSEFQGHAVSLYLDGLSHERIAVELRSDSDSVAAAIKDATRRIGAAAAERSRVVHMDDPSAASGP